MVVPDAEAFKQSSAEHLPAEDQRALAAEVDRLYLSPVPTHWGRAHDILTERVRFSLYGAVGAIAAGCSAIVAADFVDLGWTVYLAFALLTLAVVISWSAHGLLETLAYDHVTDRVTQYQNAMNGLFPNGVFKPVDPAAFAEAREAPVKRSEGIRTTANFSASIAIGGAALLLLSLAQAERGPAKASPSRTVTAAGSPPVNTNAGSLSVSSASNGHLVDGPADVIGSTQDQ